MEPSKRMCLCLATFFLHLYKFTVGWNALTDSKPRSTKNPKNAIEFNSGRSALVKSSHLCHFTQCTWPSSCLLSPFASHLWRIYHISISASPCHSVLSNWAQTCCLWPPRPGNNYGQQKEQRSGFLWDKDCQCQLQYDKCQCYEDRHEHGWAGWPFPNVTCHQSFMSPSKQYVKGIKNHYTLELCYTG